MTAARVRLALGLILLAGALARLWAWRVVPAIHPDEFFQITEPAVWHLNGIGLAAWEWTAGVRSWILPSYHGAWFALFHAFGVRAGGMLGAFVQLHWALLHLAVLVPCAYLGGSHVARRLQRTPATDAVTTDAVTTDPVTTDEAPVDGWQGGLIAAALTALLPIVVSYAPQSLSELPSMFCLVGGLVATARLAEAPHPSRKRAFLIGVLLSVGACLRVANGPLVLVAPLWLLLQRRWTHVIWLALGGLVPPIFFGLVDWITWGRFLHSALAYIQFNFVEGRAADFGVAPPGFYVERLLGRAPFALPLLAVAALAGLRASWPFVVSAAGLVAMLSTQAHKEERFVVAFWPFLIIAAGGTLGAWVAAWARARPRSPRARGIATSLVVVVIAAMLGDNLRRPVSGDLSIMRGWLDGQAAADRDPTVSGLLIESIFFSGGSLFFGRRVLQIQFLDGLLKNPMVSHALVSRGSPEESKALGAGFVPISQHDHVVLLRRR